MTQIGRFFRLVKVNITKVRAHIEFPIRRTGSVLAGTVKAVVPEVITRFEIESPDDQANPIPFKDSVVVNGRPVELW